MRPLSISDAALLAPHPPAVPGIPASGLVAQWEATSIILNDGDPVASWPDLSPSNMTATQATAAQKPIFKANIWGTKPALLFNKNAPTQMSFNPVGVPNFTVFSVVMPDFTGANAYNLAHLTWGNVAGFCLNGSASAGVGIPHITCL